MRVNLMFTWHLDNRPVPQAINGNFALKAGCYLDHRPQRPRQEEKNIRVLLANSGHHLGTRKIMFASDIHTIHLYYFHKKAMCRSSESRTSNIKDSFLKPP